MSFLCRVGFHRWLPVLRYKRNWVAPWIRCGEVCKDCRKRREIGHYGDVHVS